MDTPYVSPCKNGCQSPLSSITLNSSSSSSRTSLITLARVCRICQSETGLMVRPCACAGTMGDIHERCLNQWVAHSRAEKCEICKEPYAKSSKKLRPLLEWTKPKMSFRELLAVISLCCLLYSIINLVCVSIERKFFERVFVYHYSARASDLGRIVALLIIFVLTVTMTSIISTSISGYFAKQMVVRFVDNDTNNKNKSKECNEDVSS